MKIRALFVELRSPTISYLMLMELKKSKAGYLRWYFLRSYAVQRGTELAFANTSGGIPLIYKKNITVTKSYRFSKREYERACYEQCANSVL